MIDKKHIGKTFPSHTVEVEKGRLRFFAKAIGETNPVYFDEASAQTAGYPSLLVPLTFLFSLDLERPNPFQWLSELNLSLGRILHGSQSFYYHTPSYAGDVLTFSTQLTDIYDKKNGTLDFIVTKTVVSNQAGVHIADLNNVIVQRNG